jgi:hypothetical protein
MKFLLLSLLALFTFSSLSHADDVWLKDGTMYKHVLADTSGSVALIDMRTRVDTVDKKMILKIEWSVFSNYVTPEKIVHNARQYDPITSSDEKFNLPSSQIAAAFNNYESQKQEKATGFLWSAIIPGAGVIYTEDETGWLFMAGEIGAAWWLGSAEKNGRAAPAISLLVLRVLEFTLINSNVEENNYALRLKLFGARNALGNITPQIGIKINL